MKNESFFLVGTSIYDKVARSFSAPAYYANEDVGMREFGRFLSAQPDNIKTDFEFYKVCEFDVVSATVVTSDRPELLCKGEDFLGGSSHNGAQ